MDGSKVAAAWAAGRYADVAAYCMADVAATREQLCEVWRPEAAPKNVTKGAIHEHAQELAPKRTIHPGRSTRTSVPVSIAREGRDFDVKFHADNGAAATAVKDGARSDGKSAPESATAAALNTICPRSR